MLANFGRSVAFFQLVFIIAANLFQVYYAKKRLAFKRSYSFVLLYAISDIVMSLVMILSFIIHSCTVLHINCDKTCDEEEDKAENIFCKTENVKEEEEERIKLLNQIISFLSNTALMCSTWAVVVISCDRLKGIVFPLKAKSAYIFRNIKFLILCIVLGMIVSNISRFWESITVLKHEKSNETAVVKDLSLTNFDKFKIIFMSIRIIVNILIPSIFLLLINGVLVYHINNKKLTFEIVRWNLLKKSFESEMSEPSEKKTFWSFSSSSNKDLSLENRITRKIVILVVVHTITFLPTAIYNGYFEVVLPLSYIYYNSTLPSFNIQLVYDDNFDFNIRKDLALIPITLLFFGKMIIGFIMSNFMVFLTEHSHKIPLVKSLFQSKTQTSSTSKRVSILAQRKETRVYYSTIRQTTGEETANIEIKNSRKIIKNTKPK